MSYQYGSQHYPARPRYLMASGAFNPRSPPNVVPTASLVQMSPGTSLRSYATQGGHGLPPAYPYQQGPQSPSHQPACSNSSPGGGQMSPPSCGHNGPPRINVSHPAVSQYPAVTQYQGHPGYNTSPLSPGQLQAMRMAQHSMGHPSDNSTPPPVTSHSPLVPPYHSGGSASRMSHSHYDPRYGVSNMPDHERSFLFPNAMFSPPVPGNGAVKNGPTDGGIYGYKQSGMNDSGVWTSNQPAGFEGRFEDPRSQYNGNHGNGPDPRIEHFLGPGPADDKGDIYSRSSYPVRDGLTAQGMMGNSMSPDALGGGKPTCPPYYPFKRSVEESARGGRSSEKFTETKRRKSNSVYSPGPEDYPQDSPRYNSPKPGYGVYMDHPPGSVDPWSGGQGGLPSSYPSSLLPGSSGPFPPQSSYPPNMQHPGEMYPVSPLQDQHPQLPPMSSFRGGQPVGGVPSSGAGYTGASSPTINGSDMMSSRQPAMSSSGNAVGKALASIYSTEQTNSSYGSNHSTPVSSPTPITGSSSQAWNRPVSQSGTTYEANHIHPMGRIEERLDLDDAIHVLRTHAEGQPPLPPGHPGLPPPMLPTGAHPPLGSLGPYPPGMMGLDSSLIGHHGIPNDRVPPSSSLPSVSSDQHKSYDTGDDPDASSDGPIKLEKSEKDGEKADKSGGDKSSKGGSQSGEPPSKRARTHGKASSNHEDGYDNSIDRSSLKSAANKNAKNSEEEDLSPAAKAERERLRRQANNARERVRVRDINEAFKELGQMVTLHCNSSQPLTKLMVLQQAVNVITSLESQVRERNLNPKAACLKRREEEKTEELPGRTLSSEDLASGLANKCPPEPGKGSWHSW
ncbi:transcription factor 4-like isoform X3 [Physella acuta]|uniref:transcription factor 4-like isoform X3 n=1 Tax=Physella acuta TaxID=109671 RepID=UPI0027DD044A|nr:transcription factor 4-like isoform X3 [Physella acuta]